MKTTAELEIELTARKGVLASWHDGLTQMECAAAHHVTQSFVSRLLHAEGMVETNSQAERKRRRAAYG